MAASAGPKLAACSAGGADGPQFPVDVPDRSRRFRFPQLREHAKPLEAFALTQPVGSSREVGDGVADHMTLGPAQPRRGQLDLRDRRVIE